MNTVQSAKLDATEQREFTRALNKAKIAIMEHKNSAFISTVLFNMKLQITRDLPTAGVDGVHLYINPDFFLSQSPSIRKSILFHEAWHLAWNHPARCAAADLNQDKYNIAGDYVINIMGKDQGFEIPDTWYCDAQYRKKSTLEVYNSLPDDMKMKEEGMGCDIIKNGEEGGEDDTTSKEEMKKLDIQWANIIERAKMASKLSNDEPGSIPGDILRMFEEIRNPKLAWNEILLNYMTAYAKDDYSYRRPNRKFWPDFYLPSCYSEQVDHIAIAVDTSGSVTKEEFSQFRSEIYSITEALHPKQVTIISFDTEITKITTLEEGDDIQDIKFIGGGGTNIDETWEWIQKEQPICTIIFSDMEFVYPESKPNSDVLWVAVNNNKVKMPYGPTIHLGTD